MALNLSPSTGSSPPQSVEKITRLAQDYEYSPSVPLRSWLRTAARMMREARIYLNEGHDEQAYLLLFRHAQLVLVQLAKHPEAKEDGGRKDLVAAEKEVKRNLEILEKLKPRINKRYERYTQRLRERQSHTPSSHTVSPVPTVQRTPPHDPVLSGVVEPLEAGENRDLAVKLAKTEISRRATVRNAMRQGRLSPEEEWSRRTAGVWGDWEEALHRNEGRDEDDLSRRIQEVKVNLEHGLQADHRPSQPSVQPLKSTPPTTTTTTTYNYPTVPRQKPLEPFVPTGTKAPREKRTLTKPPPTRPPKESFDIGRPLGPEIPPPPPRPGKISSPLSDAEAVPALSAKVKPAGRDESVDQKLDPASFTFKPSAYLENGTPLRTVFLPPQLRLHFLKLAESNTRQNLETCGVLCGTLISNALFISRLLIPEQISTSDTCETVNESAMFDYCDSEDLLVLGWIHTHPTQTCFMSSRDLHTHSAYQVMLPESIAIVCAPTHNPDWGVFRLTDPPGLKSILSCEQKGLFHPHAETNVYTDALRPGHVFEAAGLEFETVDQRPSKH